MTVPPEFLDALHPSGRVLRSRNARERGGGDDKFDAMIVDENAVELNRQVAGQLALDGFVFAVPPRGRRRAWIRYLSVEGVVPAGDFLHLMSGSAEILCPIQPDAIKFMRETWPVSPRWHWVERILRHLPGSISILREILPRVSLVLHSKEDRISAWLAAVSGQTSIRPLITTSWRGSGCGAVVFGFPENNREPTVHAKAIALGKRPDFEQEALERLNRSPSADRPNIPLPLQAGGGPPWSVQTIVPGRPLERQLTQGRFTCLETVDLVSGSLLQWNLAERRSRALTPELIERHFHTPLQELRHHLPNTESYSSVLDHLAQSLVGQTVSSVVAHNDCTTANSLWDDKSGLGLVDWETCDFEGLPLADIVYSTCDVVLSAGTADRLEAFRVSFVVPGPIRDCLSAQAAKWQKTTSDPWDWLSCSFHACWIGHARNEVLTGTRGPRPFLEIVKEIASWKDPVPPFLKAVREPD